MPFRNRILWSWTFLAFLVCPGLVRGEEGKAQSGWWRGQEVRYNVIGGWAVAEGDILLGRAGEIPATAPETVEDKGAPPERSSIARSDASFLWPGGVVPFTIDDTLPDQQRIFDAIHEWNTRTSITLVPRGAEANYVHFQNDESGCNSFVGMVGGEQVINLQDNCSTGTVIHEIGHAIGLYHEQSRADRDQHVAILCHNIDTGFESQFTPRGSIAQDVLDYDYRSIMHYGASFFSTGEPTIATIPAGIPIGQRDGLSFIDINAVELLYATVPTGTTVQTNPAGLEIVVDGVTYTAPQTFDWTVGEVHEVSVNALQTMGSTTYAFAKWSNGVPDSQMFEVEAERKAITASFRDVAFVEPTSTSHIAPDSPLPSTGTTGIPNNNVVLTWGETCGAISYDVYLGIVDPVLIASDVNQTFYEVGDLDPNQTYSWKIVAKNVYGDSSARSATWTFTTTDTLILPDFVPTSVTAPTIVPVTGPIPLSGTLLNQGAAAGATVEMEFFLSPDAAITTSDDSLGSCTLGPLAGNTVGVCALTAPVPPNVGAGLFYVGAIADPGNAVVEASEANNMRLADTGIMTLGTCTYTLSVSPTEIESAPIGGVFIIATQPGCTWNARSLNTWIEVKTGFNGIGTGVGTFFVDPNPGESPRTGKLFIAGQEVEIEQLGTSTTFADVSADAFFFDAVNLMKDLQITDGCAGDPPRYCPNDLVTRGQMAVFIIRSIFGTDEFTFNPTPFFDDVPVDHPFFKWIQKLAQLGITQGCAFRQYCPSDFVTRGQMAVFIVRMRYGENVVFTAPVGQIFGDVPPGHVFYEWIQEMGQLGITDGCGGGDYCPNNHVSRGQMAVFIIRGGFNKLFNTPPPYIKSITPTQAGEGDSLTLTITGENTNFAAGISEALDGQDFSFGTVTVISPTTAIVTITVDPNISPGNRSISIKTGDEEATLPNGFDLMDSTP